MVVITMHVRQLRAASPQASAVASAIEQAAQTTLRDVRQVVGVLRSADQGGGPLHAQCADDRTDGGCSGSDQRVDR
ncbi:hypothetical protein [Nonomuraea sp. CA-141351]|uniref:hypothetical protein n=1 Tax=Nonomuraea sp. CA-141351 TaxID=3239996 RepID=UPI003D8B8FD4